MLTDNHGQHMTFEARVASKDGNKPVSIRSYPGDDYPVILRIGDPASPGSNYVDLTRQQAIIAATFLMAAGREDEHDLAPDEEIG